MISDPQVYFHPILAARCRQAHNLLPDWSELTLLGPETPVHSRWHLDPGSGESRAGDSEQPRVQHPTAFRSGTLPFTAAPRTRFVTHFSAPPQGSVQHLEPNNDP